MSYALVNDFFEMMKEQNMDQQSIWRWIMAATIFLILGCLAFLA